MTEFARAGSQRWLQVAVEHRPELLQSALRRSGALGRRETIAWCSPRAATSFREYRDTAALRLCGLAPRVPLSEFWPARGPVWDALGTTSDDSVVLVEAKAHIAEAASPATRATPQSKAMIEAALTAARRHYAPRGRAEWSGLFYQYANRLAHQFFFTQRNGLSTTLVFLYFVNATDVDGPTSEAEWRGASRLIHAVLGLPSDLTRFGVFDAFVDVRLLQDAI